MKRKNFVTREVCLQGVKSGEDMLQIGRSHDTPNFWVVMDMIFCYGYEYFFLGGGGGGGQGPPACMLKNVLNVPQSTKLRSRENLNMHDIATARNIKIA